VGRRRRRRQLAGTFSVGQKKKALAKWETVLKMKHNQKLVLRRHHRCKPYFLGLDRFFLSLKNAKSLLSHHKPQAGRRQGGCKLQLWASVVSMTACSKQRRRRQQQRLLALQCGGVLPAIETNKMSAIQ
jgi:hypothetical protein